MTILMRMAARLERWGPAAVAGLVVAGYWPALRGGFVWDDDTLVTNNPVVLAADGLRRIWLTTQPHDYWPVTYTAFWTEWHLWGAHPAPYHALSVALHLFTVLLLWRVLRRLAVPGAGLAATLFAVHPLNVESVAWIAEQKNLLAFAFAALSLLAFFPVGVGVPAAASAQPGASTAAPPSPSHLPISLVCFVLAVLSKGSTVILPLIFAAILYRRRELKWNTALRLAPFLAIAAAATAVNVWFQRHGTGEVIRTLTPLDRLLGAAGVLWFYLGKSLVPVGLEFFYANWTIASSNPAWWLPLAGAVAATAAVWRWSRRRSLLCAWVCFAAALLPAMGFTDVYYMRFAPVADQYAHLALPAVLAAVAAGYASWLERCRAAISGAGGAAIGPDEQGHFAGAPSGSPAPGARLGWQVARGAAAAAVLLLDGVTWGRCQAYRDAPTLYRTALRDNPGSWLAHNNLGALLLDAGRVGAAEAEFKAALALNPGYAEAQYNLATALARSGRWAEAIARYRAALAEKPASPSSWNNLGDAYQAIGQPAQAARAYAMAVRETPKNADYRRNLGLAWMAAGNTDAAEAEFSAALRLQPANAELHYDLALCEAAQGRWRAAEADARAAAALDPAFAAARGEIGLALVHEGNLDLALPQFEQAVRLAPNSAEAHENLAAALLAAGRPAAATAEFEAALRLRPNYPAAREGLSRARALLAP